MSNRFLVTERAESRPFEKLALLVTKPIQALAPTLLHTPIEILAKSLIANTIYVNEEKKVEILENNKIFESAKLVDKN